MGAGAISILKALDDPRLFAGAFKDAATWAAWQAFLAALFGLPMSADAASIYFACTARAELPSSAFAEAWLICGRRSGKSFIMALIAVYLGAFRDYRPYLGPGERATIMVVCADRKQARTILNYVRGLLAIPALAGLVENDTADGIELARLITIEVVTASHRATRGYTVAAGICDEVAVWPQEDSASPDVEILAAIRPAMLTIPNAMLICASSPRARKGALWLAYKRYWGSNDERVLIWRAPTLTMNPTVPLSEIEAEFERDPMRAEAELNAEFRRDVETFISQEAIDAATMPGRIELPRISGVTYRGFGDAAGGSGGDAMTLAISHAEGDRAVLDLIREAKPPFSPEAVVNDFAQVLASYGLREVVSDRWASGFVAEAWGRCGIGHTVSEKTKTEIYREFLPLINSGRIELLDQPRLLAQLASLERRTARGGRDSIDHEPTGHDDIINAAAGSLVMTAGLANRSGFDLDLYIRATS